MKLLKKAAVVAGFAAASLLTAPSYAATITNEAGTQTFTGFDWSQGGTAFTTGFEATAGNNFDLTFFSWAVSLQNGPTPFVPAGMDIDADGVDGGFEYTVVARLNENVTGCSNLIPGTISCGFSLTGGTFDVYYDTNANADILNGTGFEDGILLLSGTFAAQPGGTFTADGTGENGSGNSSLIGDISTTNLTFINPMLTGSTIGTELKIGNLTTNWIRPTGFDETAFTDENIVLQADANQSFVAAAIPVPGTVALFGSALLALGFVVRVRKS